MSEHTILVAFTVEADAGPTQAQRQLLSDLQAVPLGSGPFRQATYVTSWWIAEDDRLDGSDLDSAVFVRPGAQPVASWLLSRNDLTEPHNVVRAF